MKNLTSQDITNLLEAWNLGDVKALPDLVPLVYKELHRLAHFYMAGEGNGHTLQTTALVNEAYIRLNQLYKIDWQDRNHFYAVSSRLMRRILVDFARSRKAEKRGGDWEHVSFTEELKGLSPRSDLLDLDRTLEKLSGIDERKSKVVELRFFGGLKVDETAEVLGVSIATVMRDWDFAKAWILRELRRQ